MIFSGYQLGKYLLFPKTQKIVLDRKLLVKNGGLTIIEKGLGETKNNFTRNTIFILEGDFIDNKNESEVNERTGSEKDEKILFSRKKIFVKQPRIFESNYLISFQNEIKINEILVRGRCDSAIPKLIAVDDIFKLQYFEFIEFGSLSDLIEIPDALVASFLKELAPILSKYHCLKKDKLTTTFPNTFSFSRPLFFALNEKSFCDLLDNSSIADHKLLNQKIKESNVFSTIEKIIWNEECLIHFDLKFDNILFDESDKVIITDWELADIGDNNWDLATILFELLNFNPKATIDETIGNCLKIFNSLLSNYNNQFEANKIIQFCGIQFLQNYYYGLFPKLNLDSNKTSEWLDKAIELIKKPQRFSTLLSPSTFFCSNSGTFSAPAINTIKLYQTFRTFHNRLENDLDDLKKKILSVLSTPNAPVPTQIALKDIIYRWFFGEFDISMSEKKRIELNKTILASIPSVDKMERWVSLWWKVEVKTKNGNVVIRRSSERRIENSGHYITISDSNSSVVKINNQNDIYVNLNFFKFSVLPNTAVDTSLDFWILGKNKMPQDLPNWIRFYFHLKDNVAGIYLFLEEITKRLNDRSIPFEIKLRNKLCRYFRSDAAILFIHRDNYTACIDTISIVYNILKREDLIRENTPKFTKKFIKSNTKGLSFGENPIDSNESFGNYRAGLIADVLLQNGNWKDQNNWTEIIKKYLFEKGFNLHEMYRNPTSSITEFKYRHDLLEEKLINPPFIGLNININIELLPSQRFLKAAQYIAFTICREAIWFGDKCNWISFQKENKINKFVALNENEKIGIGLFLSAIAMICPYENIYRETSLGILNNIELSGSDDIKHSYSNKQVYEFFLSRFQYNNPVPPTISNSDNAIENIYFIFLNTWDNTTSKDPIKNLANNFKKLLGDSIIEKNIEMNLPFPNAYANNWDDPIGSEFCPTFSHGLAGIGYFFLDLSEDYINEVKNVYKPLDYILNKNKNT